GEAHGRAAPEHGGDAGPVPEHHGLRDLQRIRVGAGTAPAVVERAIARDRAVLARHALGARRPAAVGVRLQPVLDRILAARDLAGQPGARDRLADGARAVARQRAALARPAGRALRSAAVDGRLLAVLDTVGAARGLAHVVDAIGAHAVRVA